ncbi:hypothetical protein AVEN_233677-1 [Araneus ventricosus]|uniref:Uncharacterized protein n=1 Tax=Araneus ventricosus TaxID=182803 RepID=A0A4Y2MAG9_ARAVE|nr:hypothetical protein AVEN_233677-1 [Araneus ventricosus]
MHYIPYQHLYEAHLTSLFRLQISLLPNLTTIQPQVVEKKTTGRPTPQNFSIKTKRIWMKFQKFQKYRSIKVILKSTWLVRKQNSVWEQHFAYWETTNRYISDRPNLMIITRCTELN